MTGITFCCLFLSCVVLAVYAVRIRRISKKVLDGEKKLAERIVSLNIAVSDGARDGMTDIERLASGIADAYNERAELDSHIIDHFSNLTKISLSILAVAVITAVTFFI